MSPPGSGGLGATQDLHASHLAWRRLALGAAGCMFVGMGIGRFSYTTMVPTLVLADAVTAVDAGRIGMVNLSGFLFGAIVSVPVARMLGRRRAVMAMLGLCLMLLVASAAPFGASWLAACRGGIGIATGFMMVSSLALVAETAPEARRAEAAGYMFAGVGLGICSSALVVPILLDRGLFVLWASLAAAAIFGGLIAAWGWRHAPEPVAMPSAATGAQSHGPLATPALKALLVAHLLFGIGLVPHTLYWVDFLLRSVGASAAEVAVNWSLVGVFAFLGPMLATALAHVAGTWRALIIAFIAIGLGIAAPALVTLAGLAAPGTIPDPTAVSGATLSTFTARLIVSSVLFGAQPGLSSLMAARARDLGHAELMPRIMRTMILGSASGSLVGGVIVPWIYGLTGRHEPLFLMGGVAMLLAGVAAWMAAEADTVLTAPPSASGQDRGAASSR